ncbi:MAG: PorT family protein [Bacteroidia bacterium]|nr:PorT family protein [Bacteroidia bacterium]
MKKLLSLFLVSLLSTSLFAQDSSPAAAQDAPKVRLGLRATPTINWMGFDTQHFKSSGVRMGAKFGLLMDARLGKNYAIGTGLDFVMAGGIASISDSVIKVNETDGIFDTILMNQRTYKLQYVEIPLTLKLKTNQIGYFTYFVQLGGSVGFNVSAKSIEAGKSLTTGKEYAETVKLKAGLASGSEVKLVRAEVNIGVGAEWAIQGNLGLLFGVSYHKGVTNVFNGSNKNLQNYFKVPVNGTNTVSIQQKSTNSYVAVDIALLF